MPDWAGPILENAPWGLVIIVLAVVVTKAQAARDILFADALQHMHTTLGEVRGSIKDNTMMLGEVRGVLTKLNGNVKET